MCLGSDQQPADNAFSTSAFVTFTSSASLFATRTGSDFYIKITTANGSIFQTAVFGPFTLSTPTVTGIGLSTETAPNASGLTGPRYLVHNSTAGGTAQFKIFGTGLTPGVTFWISPAVSGNVGAFPANTGFPTASFAYHSSTSVLITVTNTSGSIIPLNSSLDLTVRFASATTALSGAAPAGVPIGFYKVSNAFKVATASPLT